MKKLLALSILVFAISCLMVACGGTDQGYARVDIYSADGTLLQSIDSTEMLTEIRKNVHMGEPDITTEAIPDVAVPQYRFVFFSETGNGEITENHIFTIYESGSLIHNEYPSASKFPNALEAITYQSEEAVQYLRSLIHAATQEPTAPQPS